MLNLLIRCLHEWYHFGPDDLLQGCHRQIGKENRLEIILHCSSTLINMSEKVTIKSFSCFVYQRKLSLVKINSIREKYDLNVKIDKRIEFKNTKFQYINKNSFSFFEIITTQRDLFSRLTQLQITEFTLTRTPKIDTK